MAGGSGAKSPASGNYTAKQLAVLEGLDAVRKRPGMYIGSTDGRGLMHCVWEIVDNSVDEALAGHGTRITIVLHLDGSIEVRDDGRGIPVDIEPRTKLSGVELVLTKLHAGGKFGGGSYGASGGLHGVGASVVNALSERMDVEIDRDGKTHAMSFRRGVPGTFADPTPAGAFAKAGGLRVIGRTKGRTTGTRVRFWPDRALFTADAEVSIDELASRARQTSYLVPGLVIELRDERTRSSEVFEHRGGIGEFVDFLASDQGVTNMIRLRGSGHFKETVPVLDGKGHLASQEVERELLVDIALRWGEGYDSDVRSFVNIIATPKGGTHVTGFERAMVKVINDGLRAAKVLRTGEDNVTKDDVLEGLTAVIAVRLPEPQFEGQTKEVLGTPAATRIVGHVVTKELTSYLESPPRGEKVSARAILDKVAGASRTRLAARAHRDVQRRKNALETSALPTKLKDCRSDETELCELFIVEGDSALGTAKNARNSEFQAILPIRGKILNVQKASVADMLKNNECASIIQVIGAGSGRSFDLEQARYGKIIMMSDADVDGAHIRCLLLTLFHRYLRPLLDAGQVYAAVPPLHRIEVSGSSEVKYTYSDAELHAYLGELERRGKRFKDPQRYKGLGEMDAEQLRETTMSPATRTLRRITMSDAAAADSVFDLLMGSDVPPRKEFIVEGAAGLTRDRIDA